MSEARDPAFADELAPEFEVVRRIGRGSVADLFLGREVALKRLVALKVLRPEIARDETARKRFIREGRSAARIKHPNVVGLHRVGSLSDKRPYLVMEYVGGRDLESLLAAEGERSLEEGREILAQLAGALQAAHDHGIVHRDVRPGNVMREKETGRIVLTDFGIAGVLERDGESVTRITKAGQRLGDMKYASPEQIQGEPVTAAGDVYSLAVLGYEILTGRGPFEAEAPAKLIRAHLQEEPVPLDRLRFDADPGLTDLLLRCLAKDPAHRPSAKTVARVLRADAAGEGAATGEVLGLRGPPAVQRFLRELKRRKVYNVVVAYAAAAFIVLEGADAILPALPLPDWTYTALVSVALAAFPVVLVLGWMYDLTAGGLRRTRDASPGTQARIRSYQVLGIVLSLVLAGLIGLWILT